MRIGPDQLLSAYEHGRLTRRELLGALSALIVSARETEAASPAIGKVKQLNHVTLFVSDVQKSTEFYQRLFDMPLLTRQGAGVNLNAGSGFVGIYPAQPNSSGAINHLCLGLENFDADVVAKTLKSQGVPANIRLRGETKELYLTDPDNIRVQLQDVRYRGGEGPLGDRNPR